MLIFLSGNRPLGQNRTDYLSSFFLQVAPALYTHKVAHKKAIEKQQERIANLQLKLQSDGKIDMDDMSANNETDEGPVRKKKFIFGIFLRGLTKFQEFVHRNLNLIQLLTPMLLQDGPFLIVRLVLVAYYKVTGMILNRIDSSLSRVENRSNTLYYFVWFHSLVSRGAGAAGAAAPLLPFAHGGQLCPFLIAIELFYHPNNFASDVRNVINESELIIVGCIGRHWSF